MMLGTSPTQEKPKHINTNSDEKGSKNDFALSARTTCASHQENHNFINRLFSFKFEPKKPIKLQKGQNNYVFFLMNHNTRNNFFISRR